MTSFFFNQKKISSVGRFFRFFICFYYYITTCEFFTLALADHWNLIDSKSYLVNRTLLSILADLNKAVVGMVSARSPISYSSISLTKLLEIVPSAPITIGITVTFMFNSFFRSLARSKYSFLFSFSLIFILLSAGTPKSIIRQAFIFYFFLIFSFIFGCLQFFIGYLPKTSSEGRQW